MKNEMQYLDDLIVSARNKNKKYPVNAYRFVYSAISYTSSVVLQREGHMSGTELLDGIKKLAYMEFGPLADRVLKTWNIKSAKDIGAIVYTLIDSEILAKDENDAPNVFINNTSFSNNDYWERFFDEELKVY